MSGPHFEDDGAKIYFLGDPGEGAFHGPSWLLRGIADQEDPPPSRTAGDDDQQGQGTDPSRS